MKEWEAWKLLQIAPTASKREIRKAYAELVKLAHPEEKPEAFAQLKEAYQCALQAAEHSASVLEMESEEEKRGLRADGTRQRTSVLETKSEKETQSFCVEGAECRASIQETDIEKSESLQAKLAYQMSLWEGAFQQWLEDLNELVRVYDQISLFAISPLSIPHHVTYTRASYTESDELKAWVDKLFAEPMAEHFCFQKETRSYLAELIKQSEFGQRLLPLALVSAFYQQYAKHMFTIQTEEENQILRYLMKLMTFYRRLPEYNCWTPFLYENADAGHIEEANLEFWEYFFTYGFGCRHAWGDKKQTLTEYMEEIYQPSLEWRKRFTGFDKKTPTQYEFCLHDETSVSVEFHLYYVRYDWNGKPEHERIPYSRLVDEVKCGLTTEQFFFLLALTDIKEEERYSAKHMIRSYLERLPLYPPTMETIAECLANDCTPQALPEHEKKRVYLTLYAEDERFCFRIQATPRKFEIHRYAPEGWVQLPLLAGHAKAYKACPFEERPAYLQKELEQLIQPKPILRQRSIFVEGSPVGEKRLKILDALREYGKWRRREAYGNDSVYIPGFPWGKEDLFPAVYDFFAEFGGYMTNGYVVLRLGSCTGAYFHRIFTVCMNIFGYDMDTQSPQIAKRYANRLKLTERFVQESRFLTVGRIGWGESTVPYPITIGESNHFYSFDENIGLVKADSFDELLGILFDFEDVTEIEIFRGLITVSKFDHRLEYCYQEKDLKAYLNGEKTMPELFSKFHV